MKRRQRKPVLDINGESDSPRRRWPHERHPQNGSPSNPLANFLGQYNSDSEADDDSKPRAHKLNDQVNDFLKEIQSIAPDSNKNNQDAIMPHPGSYWQECYDEQTGYPYYWHTETNQVTWEMPPELKMMHEKNQRESQPQGSHIPQWSNMTSNKFSQSPSNIPEGMIPKEVVVRNRNRQAGIQSKPTKPPAKPDHSKSPFKKDDSSDDGRIEMITSFGNEDSESEESDHEQSSKKVQPLPKKSSLKPAKPSAPLVPSNKALESSDFKAPVGPALPSLHYGPQNKEKLSEKLSQNLQTTKTTSLDSSEEDIIKRLKNQAKLLQYREGSNSSKSESNNEALSDSKNIDLKLSLVPGYEDDSDGDEDAGSLARKQSAKPLFPISESVNNDSNPNDKIAKRIETSSGNIRIYEYRNESVSVEDKVEEENNSNDNNEERQEDAKTEQEAKANKFLESIDAPTKAFQRKRRIAFDVAPNKSKTTDPITKDESPSGPHNVSSSTNGEERRGLGFSKEDSVVSSPITDTNKSEPETTSKRPPISFVKASKTEERSSSPKASSKPKEVSEADKAEMKALTEPIMEKLKFLSEGSPAASAVQVMAIQIQTLLCAWEANELNDSYLRNWLVGTGCELTRLEQTAAPPGWECQWDRSHKRYYYRNVSTGEAQWTYPQTDIVGGTEEMELCTTPPPPEHEEAPIIEMSAQAATMSSKDSSGKETDKQQQSTTPSLPVGEPTIPPPPPPDISSPCTPPPPRISDDIRRSKKRRHSPEISEAKEEPKDAKPAGAEPLPPGVDPPEIAYSLPASALEAGVLYSAQQTNPIYAATLAGAGIPILPHHHTAALMQGQLMHYNPAYHQHLHNQALVAARLSGQEAVQFMVAAEYARVYENNQVIAKPPMKMPHETSLGSAINSFYSDIASIEKSTAELEKEKAELRPAESVPSPIPQTASVEADAATSEAMKEKKKKKLKTGLGKKQKEMSSMVAKWQRAQKNYKEGH